MVPIPSVTDSSSNVKDITVMNLLIVSIHVALNHLLSLVSTSSIILNRSCNISHPCLVPDFRVHGIL
ncbi:hypothetical protein CapIbe_001046 [Capra ibex]